MQGLIGAFFDCGYGRSFGLNSTKYLDRGGCENLSGILQGHGTVVVQSTCPQNGHAVGYLFGWDGWDPLLRRHIPNISQWSLVYKDFEHNPHMGVFKEDIHGASEVTRNMLLFSELKYL